MGSRYIGNLQAIVRCAREMRVRFYRSIPSISSIGCIVESGSFDRFIWNNMYRKRNDIRKRTTMLRNNRFESFAECLDGRHPFDAEEAATESTDFWAFSNQDRAQTRKPRHLE